MSIMLSPSPQASEDSKFHLRQGKPERFGESAEAMGGAAVSSDEETHLGMMMAHLDSSDLRQTKQTQPYQFRHH